jgi:predicted methyltransferase
LPRTQEAIHAAVNAPDRSPEDTKLDAQRRPEQMLAFFAIKPGMRVAELAAGGGYTSELLARVVGPSGQLFGQNNRFVLERFAEVPWTKRLKKPVMQNVTRLDSEFDAPFPPEVRDLDAVLMVLFYHDTVWMQTDRKAMNQAIFATLKAGGVYGIVDHSGRPGTGSSEAQALHRIEESLVIEEVEAAGFKLQARADFLRNPDDTRDWNASPSAAGEKRGQSDRFVLRFIKPKATGQDDAASTAESARIACTDPRPEMCTRDYRPVCADVDTGVRCVTTPCPAARQETYGNACSACADPKVYSHVPGECRP